MVRSYQTRNLGPQIQSQILIYKFSISRWVDTRLIFHVLSIGCDNWRICQSCPFFFHLPKITGSSHVAILGSASSQLCLLNLSRPGFPAWTAQWQFWQRLAILSSELSPPLLRYWIWWACVTLVLPQASQRPWNRSRRRPMVSFETLLRSRRRFPMISIFLLVKNHHH